MDISKRLKDIRTEKGYEITDLADKLSREISEIEAWEDGSKSPSATDLLGLSDVYGMTLDEMIYKDAKAPEYNMDKGSFGAANVKKSAGKSGVKNAFTQKEWLTLLVFPIMCVAVFLILGIFMNLWHPGWIVLVAIPVYYGMVILFRHLGNDAAEAVEDYIDEQK